MRTHFPLSLALRHRPARLTLEAFDRRFGSCGSLDPSLPVGSIGVPKHALQISTNYAHWHGDGDKQAEQPYLFSPPVRLALSSRCAAPGGRADSFSTRADSG